MPPETVRSQMQGVMDRMHHRLEAAAELLRRALEA